MNIYDYRFYKYICIIAICGVMSSIMAIGCWYLISGVNLMKCFLDILGVFVTCWCIGGIGSLFLYPYLRHLAFFTYMFSIVVFMIITLYWGGWDNPSIRGWTAASILGYGIVCLPVYYINARYLINRL